MQIQDSLSPQQKKILWLSSLGGVLEYYDFIIYIFLAPYIEKVFFSQNETFVATLKTLAIFSIGYLIRPIGGIIFSHYGDRYGRKVIFLLTVLFMAVPSFAIGLLPTPLQIGIASPLLLLLFRVMQGFALGGEIPAAITFVSEHIGYHRRGFALATLFFGINIGLLLGSLVTSALTSLFQESDVLAFGWRIPFIMGGFFGIASIFLRRYLHETAAFTALHSQEIERLPSLTLLRLHSHKVLQGVLLASLGAVTIFFYLYWPQYLHQNMNYDFAQLMHINSMGTMVLSLMIFVGGWLTDRYGFSTIYLLASVSLILLAYPLFMVFNAGSIFLVATSYFIFSLIFGLIPTAYTGMLSDLFPTPVRYSGIALSYNLAYAFIGGLSPIVCTLLIHLFKTSLAPAYYVILIATIAAGSCYLGQRQLKAATAPS